LGGISDIGYQISGSKEGEVANGEIRRKDNAETLSTLRSAEKKEYSPGGTRRACRNPRKDEGEIVVVVRRSLRFAEGTRRGQPRVQAVGA
jgi:hypothetical protein